MGKSGVARGAAPLCKTIVFAGVFAFFGCSSLSPEARSVATVSDIVWATWEREGSALYNAPVVLETRENPCTCDAHLRYEIKLNGYWHHVFVEGDGAALEALDTYAKNASAASFEYRFLLTRRVFTSATGQKYYVLVLI